MQFEHIDAPLPQAMSSVPGRQEPLAGSQQPAHDGLHVPPSVAGASSPPPPASSPPPAEEPELLCVPLDEVPLLADEPLEGPVTDASGCEPPALEPLLAEPLAVYEPRESVATPDAQADASITAGTPKVTATFENRSHAISIAHLAAAHRPRAMVRPAGP